MGKNLKDKINQRLEAIKVENQPSEHSFNLSLQMESDKAVIFDAWAKKLNYSRAELANVLIEDGLEELGMPDVAEMEAVVVAGESKAVNLIEQVLPSIDKIPSEKTFVFKNLFGKSWKGISKGEKISMGKKFYRLVTDGEVDGVEALKKRDANNHRVYQKN